MPLATALRGGRNHFSSSGERPPEPCQHRQIGVAVSRLLGRDRDGAPVRVLHDEPLARRLTLADLLGTTPQSSRGFKELVASSRFYGLTTGGINSEEFAVTRLGERATSDDEAQRVPALKEAVMRVEPFRAFFDAFSSKKVPGAIPAKEFLTRNRPCRRLTPSTASTTSSRTPRQPDSCGS
jgi:hypothetical protein